MEQNNKQINENYTKMKKKETEKQFNNPLTKFK